MRFHKLQCAFIWNDSFNVGDSDNLKSLYLYYNYLAVKNNDTEAYNNIQTTLKEIKPQYMCAGTHFFDDHMHEYANKTEKVLNEAIEEIDFSQVFYWGMSVNLYQWVTTSIIADKIKNNNPEVPILIGGIGTPEMATAYLDNFKQFDVAFWGEAEFSLLDYSTQIRDGNLNLSQINDIVYRQGESISASVRGRKKYVDLSSKSVGAIYKDYFVDLEKYKIQQSSVCLPIERSRSCHRKKCHFCYLNQGYRYRKKETDRLIDEFEYLTSNHKINSNFLITIL